MDMLLKLGGGGDEYFQVFGGILLKNLLIRWIFGIRIAKSAILL